MGRPLPVISRRDMIKHAALGAVAASVVVHETVQAVTETPAKHHWGMVIDTRRCVGCEACVIACKLENKTPPGVFYTVVTREPLPGGGNDRPVFMTKPCFHCEEPPCVPVCPVDATYKRKSDGIVVVDYDRCIGCRYCIAACPYGARSFDFGDDYGSWHRPRVTPSRRNTSSTASGRPKARRSATSASARSASTSRTRSGAVRPRGRALARLRQDLPGHAIYFGDLATRRATSRACFSERNAVRLKEELGTEPSVYYLL